MRTRFRAIVVLAGLLVPLCTALPAGAHAELAAASLELRLTFTEPLELAFSEVTVKSTDGTAVVTGPLALDPADARILIVPLTGPSNGPLTVEWTVVSTDGHKVEGTQTYPGSP